MKDANNVWTGIFYCTHIHGLALLIRYHMGSCNGYDGRRHTAPGWNTRMMMYLPQDAVSQ